MRGSALARRASGALLAGALVTAGLAGATAAGAAPSSDGQVIASGLNNPRGITFGPRGSLFVTEAGLGGGTAATGVQEGLGTTGRVTEIGQPASAHPTTRVAIDGLPSAASDEGNGPEAIGPDGLVATGNGADTQLEIQVGAAGIPNTWFGHALSWSSRTGSLTSLADVGSTDLAWTGDHADAPWAPPGQFPDSNPYGITTANGRTYVVDAGANTLDEINADGSVSVLAYFPNTAISDAVPTCVQQGPDGALYIGTLALADFFVHGPGQATVWRVDPGTTDPTNLDTVLHVATPWATGLNTITGCSFGPSGDLYVAEMFTGRVVRIPFTHPATGRTMIGEGQLVLPNGVTVGPDGSVYVTDHSSVQASGAGRVLRFRGTGPIR